MLILDHFAHLENSFDDKYQHLSTIEQRLANTITINKVIN